MSESSTPDTLAVSAAPIDLPATMRAAVLFGPSDLRLVDDYPTPAPGEGEVVVEVASCAICGTDPDILRRGWPGMPPYGTFVFGHEYAGTIAAVGPSVDGLAVGDRVAVEAHKGCGTCDNCRDGLYTTCLNYGDARKGHRHYGFTTNGGYAQYARISAMCVYPIPDSMSFETATLVTTAGTSLYGIRRTGGLDGGETVVVSGPGPIGLMGVLLARLMGAGTIVVAGTREERLSLGRQLGADVAINVREEDVVARVLELTNGHGADVVLECAGTEASAAAAIDYTKMSGRIALVGVHAENPVIALNARKIALGNLTIVGTRAEGQRSVPRVLSLLEHTDADLSSLITHRFGLAEINEAFEVADTRRDAAVKVLVNPKSFAVQRREST